MGDIGGAIAAAFFVVLFVGLALGAVAYFVVSTFGWAGAFFTLIGVSIVCWIFNRMFYD